MDDLSQVGFLFHVPSFISTLIAIVEYIISLESVIKRNIKSNAGINKQTYSKILT